MATQQDSKTRRKRSRIRQDRSSAAQGGLDTSQLADALNRGFTRLIGATADLAEEATQAVGAVVRSMRSAPILDARDFGEVRSWQHSDGTMRMSVESVKPLGGGRIIQGYRCNNNIEITIRITDSSRPHIYQDYLKSQQRLKKSIQKAINSDGFRLVSVTPREGSLILVLVICYAGLAIWMASQDPETVEWFHDHKEDIGYWTGLISNSLTILIKIFQIFGGSAPA
jgi:hypothetical protein